MLAGVILFASCKPNTESGSDTALLGKIDSLELALMDAKYTATILEQVGLYMDSIDLNRNLVKLELETGLSTEDYIERMKSINEYTQKAQWSIAELEKTNNKYASQVKRFKQQITKLETDVASLQQSVDLFQSKNEDLLTLLAISDDELSELELELEVSGLELEETNEKIVSLSDKITLTEAEKHYVKGEGMEAVAEHIQFAPKKKKQTMEDALASYDKAYSMGYEPAKVKIDQMKLKLKVK